jgi:hypothetical protein
MGGYPIKIDFSTREHRAIKSNFKNLLLSLKYTMPCVFCRESFQEFCKDLPIEPYLIGRIELMYWLYLIKDKVNEKLMSQEAECYNNEKKRLKAKYHSKKISKLEYYNKLDAFKKETFITSKSPPFIDVLNKYESIRAVCSKKAKTCSLPKR